MGPAAAHAHSRPEELLLSSGVVLWLPVSHFLRPEFAGDHGGMVLVPPAEPAGGGWGLQ